MPFPEPETALAATIGAGAKGQVLRDKTPPPGGDKGAFYDFSIIYTKTQQLKGRFGQNPRVKEYERLLISIDNRLRARRHGL
jgi:hypothetical protein